MLRDAADQPGETRRYLLVAYDEKDEAKALGAKWDPSIKRWYIPEEMEEVPFRRWLPFPSHGLPRVMIYTDGSCRPNPGGGGWAYLLKRRRHKAQAVSKGYVKTTNQRMELLACIEALRTLQVTSYVIVLSDSKYVVSGIRKNWAAGWKAHNWVRREGDPACNSDLWAELLTLSRRHKTKFVLIPGHRGNHKGNKVCDWLARHAPRVERDRAYEEGETYGAKGARMARACR